MLRRLLSLTLIVGLVPVSAFADIRTSIAEQAALAAAQQTTSSPRVNPYKTPAIGLMAGGAGLLILGLLQDRGAEVSTAGTTVSVKEKGGSKTALTALGVLAGAGGATLWFLGEKKKALPSQLWFSPSGAGFSHSVTF